jgi:hypothetical protein
VSAVAGSPIQLVPGNRIVARTTDVDDTMHRLASWLADVSAEASRGQEPSPAQLREPRRPRVEPPR